ncbi:hypothetical protein KKB99_07230, partial [bacterium]|nr:hypothetical protein [bacterium]MBU1025784.1 hypothetical protein [bacterium]
ASRDAGTEDKFIVYYFHITKRCATCLRIEKYTNEAIITGFLPEMTIGKLEMSTINTDLAGNEHFLTDFELSTRSVVLAHMVDDEIVKWKNLVRVWELNNNREEFVNYITEETREFLDSQNE